MKGEELPLWHAIIKRCMVQEKQIVLLDQKELVELGTNRELVIVVVAFVHVCAATHNR